MLSAKEVCRVVSQHRFISNCFARSRYSPHSSAAPPACRLMTSGDATRLFSTLQSTQEIISRNCRQTSIQNLKRRTQQWLRQEVATWKTQDSNAARCLLEQWMLSSEKSEAETARIVTRIYYKWITNTHFNPQRNYSLLVESLNRILHVWKQARPTNMQDLDRPFHVFQITLQEAQSAKSKSLLPQDKTFSSLFDLLAITANLSETETMAHARTLLSKRLRLLELPNPDLQFWNSFLNVLAKSSSKDPTLVNEAEEILEALKEIADEWTIASVLEAWVHSGRPEAGERAQYHLDHMTRAGIFNTVCFNLTIEAWAVTGHPEAAEACLMQMVQLSRRHPARITPDSKSFLAAVRGWSSDSNVERTERLVEMMQCVSAEGGDGSILPASEAFVAILQAWARRGDAGPQVDKLLRASVSRVLHSDDTGESNWLSPQAFTVAINAWANTSNPDAPLKAEALLEQMEKLSMTGYERLAPNHFHFSAAIGAWASSDRGDGSSEILRILSRCNTQVGPYQTVYNAALSALGRLGKALEADRLLREMQCFEHGSASYVAVAPDCASYTHVVRAYYKCRHHDAPPRSDELLREMEYLFDHGDEALKPSETTYYFTILAQSLQSVEAAENIFWKMVQRYNDDNRCAAPTLRVCNKILELWARSASDGHAPQKAENLLRWLKNDGCRGTLRPDEYSYLQVVDAWNRSGRRSASRHIEGVLQMMNRDLNG